MIIELWTMKRFGKSKGSYTLWKTFDSSHETIPPINSTLIYSDKKGKSKKFQIKQIEYEYRSIARSFRVQLCVVELKK